MTIQIKKEIEQQIAVYFTEEPEFSYLGAELAEAIELLVATFRTGNKILICGNGGSCCDSDHIVGELMKNFMIRRSFPELTGFQDWGETGQYLSRNLQVGLPAISLCAHSGLITAIANDMGADLIYAQQVVGYGQPGDVLLAISTSGNSTNVLNACITAKVQKLKVIALVGGDGGKMEAVADIAIRVNKSQTDKIQERHLRIYHLICRVVERIIFYDTKSNVN